jgi:hypothetical protein
VGKRDKRGVEGHLRIVLLHLLKWQVQSNHGFRFSARIASAQKLPNLAGAEVVGSFHPHFVQQYACHLRIIRRRRRGPYRFDKRKAG